MIDSFTLKFGSQPDSLGQTIPAAPVTVFVGPNNSGKSKALTEIVRFCREGTKDANARLLEEVTFSGLEHSHAVSAIEQVKQPPNNGESQQLGHVFVGSKHGRLQVPYDKLLNFIENPSSNLNAFCQWFLKHNTLILDGSSRIGLVNDQAAGDLQMPAQTSLQVLFRDDSKRHEVRRIIHEAFGVHFVLDPTNLGQLRIRLAKRAPRDDLEERGIHADAVRFHSNADHIGVGSDGVKAFTGIIVEVMAGDPRILLIDEPEAFLHPSLSSKLGIELSRAALAADKRVFVSTHSPAFVMGCIQSGAPVNIVRLTYRGGVPTARVLPSDDLVTLMKHPLLRSTGVLTGLFYEFVVVAESDADRAFYQEMNERLLHDNSEWGIPNCLFINAQNKQTVQTIIRPLRKLGIPAAGIVDVDVLKDGGTTWTKLLESAAVPSISHSSLATIRGDLRRAMEGTGKNMKKDGGVLILPEPEQEAARNLFSQLAEYGMFVVPGGELESWLKPLGVDGHGPNWLIKMFDAIGHEPSDENYVKPAKDDVWRFIGNIKAWLVDANRKGIPS